MNKTSLLENLNHLSEASLLNHFHQERERARQHSLSEVSDLVLHDLTNPLSVVKFCLEQLETNPGLLLQRPQYLEKMKNNLDRAFGIIDSFRAVVRAEHATTTGRLDLCHRAATRLILNQFKMDQQFLTIDFDSALEGVSVRVPHFELVYFLETLYRLILGQSTETASPVLQLSVKKDSIIGDQLTLLITNRGTPDATNSTTTDLTLNDVLEAINFRAIQTQLSNYGGSIELLSEFATSTTKAAIRIYLPLLRTEEDKGANQ